MPQPKYLKLGELLIQAGLIKQAQLEKALSVQKQQGGRLGDIFVKLEMVTEEQVVTALGKQLGIPYFSLGTGVLKPALDQGLEELIPHETCRRNMVLPLSRTLNSLTVAMNDPLDLILIDNLKKLTGCEINPVIATRVDIAKAIDEFFGKKSLLEAAVEESYESPMTELTTAAEPKAGEELSIDTLIARAEEAPVVKLVDLILRQAIDERASDIHLEPFKDFISLRYRIDGKLCEIPPPAKHLYLPIASRIKILSKLDIAEKRLPQDGSFTVKLENRFIDIRVSTIPTIYGEKIVMRILDKGSMLFDLNRLGFTSGQLDSLRKAIDAPYGLVLLTGPTGSGKTTTLYSILNQLKHPTKNIVTVEDPVEYHMEGINQVQVKPEIGLTFAAALRSFMRQDPDIMLVGEIRDLETAEICIRAALTGHLVLSTLHTNDAPSAISRIIDIGVPYYLLIPSLVIVVAQRLVRRLCPDCKEAYEPTTKQLGQLKLKSNLIYRAKGCPKCNFIGYKGRIAVGEAMLIDEGLRQLISEEAPFQKLRQASRAAGMQTIYDSALIKAEEGITSLEEALSVAVGGD